MTQQGSTVQVIYNFIMTATTFILIIHKNPITSFLVKYCSVKQLGFHNIHFHYNIKPTTILLKHLVMQSETGFLPTQFYGRAKPYYFFRLNNHNSDISIQYCWHFLCLVSHLWAFALDFYLIKTLQQQSGQWYYIWVRNKKIKSPLFFSFPMGVFWR